MQEFVNIKNNAGGRHFNKNAFTEKLLGNTSLYEELIAYSFIQIPQDIQNIKKYIAEKNVEKIKMSAHKLKGTSLNMCFEILAEIAIKIEDCCENDSGLYGPYIEKAESEWNEVKKELKAGS